MKQCPFKIGAVAKDFCLINSGHPSGQYQDILDRSRIAYCTPDCQLWDADQQDCVLGVMAQEIKKIRRGE